MCWSIPPELRGRVKAGHGNMVPLKVLEENELSCVELMHVKSDGVVLTKQKVDSIWATEQWRLRIPKDHKEHISNQATAIFDTNNDLFLDRRSLKKDGYNRCREPVGHNGNVTIND
ncbi:hypothetical protein ACQ4PT_030302 [Festuca glaucescens]